VREIAALQRCEKITTLLSRKVTNAKNEIILCALRQVTIMFKTQETSQKKKNIWFFFEGNNIRNTILKFLVTINEDNR